MATEDSNEEFQFKDNDTILSDMIDTVMIRNNDVNDFTPGSILRTLLESESLELETLYYLQLENLNHAIDESVLQAFDFDPIDYVHAFGNIIIYFTDTLQKDLYIPKEQGLLVLIKPITKFILLLLLTLLRKELMLLS